LLMARSIRSGGAERRFGIGSQVWGDQARIFGPSLESPAIAPTANAAKCVITRMTITIETP